MDSAIHVFDTSQSDLMNSEYEVAFKRAGRRSYSDESATCSRGNAGRDFRARYNGERRRSAVKADTGCSSQAGSKNDHLRSDSTVDRVRLHERRQARQQLEHGAISVRSESFADSIDVSVSSLH